jgi:hypothetical protein
VGKLVTELLLLQGVRNLRSRLLPSKLLKRVLLKLLITPIRGRSPSIHLTQKMRRVMTTVKTVKNRSMGRQKRKAKVGRVLMEVEVKVLLNPCVGGAVLLLQTKAHSHLKGKPVKEEGPVSHKLHIPSSNSKFFEILSLRREMYFIISWPLYLSFF